MKKKPFYSELAYVFGILLLALGTALMERADFGISMVVAPAYLLHLKLSQFLPFFTFGMAEYTFQALLLLITVLVLQKSKLSFLFSFVTAVLYGLSLDGMMLFVRIVPFSSLFLRILLYILGFLLCCAAIAMLFRTYISPEVYELFVKGIAEKYRFNLHKVKTVYDLSSCLLAILLSFAFFGLWHFEGIKLGTILCTLVNGYTISLFSKLFDKFTVPRDALPLRRFF